MHTHNLSRLVILSNDYILLAKAKMENGEEFYFLPGGHVEYNEAIKNAAIRELKEEMGVDAKDVHEIKLIGVFETSWGNKENPHHEINFISKCNIGTLNCDRDVISQEDHLSFEWKKLNELDAVHLLPKDFKNLIPEWIAKNINESHFFKSNFNI